MAEFEEIHIEPQEAPAAPTEIPADIPGNSEDIQEKPAPKKRGRPAGAKNKPKPAPKPKSKAKAKITTVYEDDEDSEEEMPPRRSRREPVHPPELDRHALAAEVLTILQQQQRYDRTNTKRTHYASWFQNM